jgi:hypothetical protein
MPVFKIKIQNSKQYLHAIAGVTKLTRKEADMLGEIIEYMQIKKLNVLDDSVKNHIIKTAGFGGKKPEQSYYNFIASLKKKKLLLNSRNKIQLRTMLLPGTTLEITFENPVNLSDLKIYEAAEV